MARATKKTTTKTANPDGPQAATAARRSVRPTAPVEVSAPHNDKPGVTREQIAARAYELWKQRGGDPESNWLEAERQLRR